MKYVFKSLVFLSLIVSVFSCRKVEDKVFANGGTAPVLTESSSSAANFNTNNKAAQAISFNWTNPAYQLSTGPNSATVYYTLQIDTAGNNFQNVQTIGVLNGFTTSLTVSTLNSMLYSLHAPYNKLGHFEARVISALSQNSKATNLTSNVVTFTATPFKSIIAYAYPNALNVAGNYQGWSPPVAPQVVDPSTNPGTAYEGYINFTDGGTGGFKIVAGNAWSLPTGDFGFPSGTTPPNLGSSISNPAAANMSTPAGTASGVYLVKVNTVALTWSSKLISSFSLNGTATGSLDVPMSVSFASNGGAIYTATTTLSAGTFVFRANNGTAINLGDDGTNGGVPAYVGAAGEAPITVSAGTHTVTLDLSIPGNYAYSVN